MPQDDGRPTPEEMLELARSEEASRSRGRLKVFFGASPGVGKTYAMLESARVKRREGIDVVIGWIETHGRAETEMLTEGLERLPARSVEYRGVLLKEFDLEAALARRPALILVDELAHTNAPGSRHTRRWQDVQELLDAGIDVDTTLNVQHLESTNDLVARISGVVVRETVPDSLFEQASEVELVDLTPEDFLDRLHEGKIYLPAEVKRAVDNFFKKGNLIALRELALQRTADRVEQQMTSWKREQGITQPWPTRERILVAVGPAPQSADLIRAAYRMATRLHAPWIALSVETPDFHRLPLEDRERVDEHLTLAERLGAERVAFAAEEAAAAIIGVARQRNVSRIVIGKPTHGRWRDLLKGSVVDRLVRGSGPIDVLVTSGEEEPRPASKPMPAAHPAPLREYGWALLAVLGATIIGLAGRSFFNLADQAMLYLLAVLLVSSRLSRGPALVTSVASVLALDFCFVPPFFTFAISDLRYLVTFAVLLGAGLLVSNMTLRMRNQAETAQERERRTAVLHMMTRSFAFRSGVADIAEAAARHLEVLLDTEASVLLADDKRMLMHRGGSAGDLVHSERELAVARWVFDHARPAGHGTDTLPAATGLFMPLAGRKRTMGVLGLALGKRSQPLTPSQRQLLDVFVNHTALALERTMLTEEAERSRVTVETERLRNALLSSVSHDLRTPLATITGAATSMLMPDAQLAESNRRDMLETIREEAERLSRVIGNLLEVTRFESGTVRIRKEPYPLDDLISSAVARVEMPLKHHDLKVSLPDAVVEVPMDPALAEKVLVNLLENAAKYSPAGTRIEVEARRGVDEVEVEVRDRGSGIPPGEEEKIFDSFYRVPGTQDTGGMGLGLAVCRAVVKAHGGHIDARNREGGGHGLSLHPPGTRRQRGDGGEDAGARRVSRSPKTGEAPALTPGPLVLLIEDDPQLRRFLRPSLVAHGYRLLEAEGGVQGERMASQHVPDIVLLDLGLPDLDGIEVTRRIRQWSRVPIIVLSARDQEKDKILALDEGADDYLTKPFSFEELLARMRVALRHVAQMEAQGVHTEFVSGPLRVDLSARRVFVEEAEVHLTSIEYRLLAALVEHAGQVVTHRQLLHAVWGPGCADRTQYVRVYMAHLRRKLEPDPSRSRIFRTEAGVGYQLILAA